MLTDPNQRFSTLVTAVKAADLVSTVQEADALTIFAPTNDAFAKVPADALQSLLADKEALTAVLLRHVVPGQYPIINKDKDCNVPLQVSCTPRV